MYFVYTVFAENRPVPKACHQMRNIHRGYYTEVAMQELPSLGFDTATTSDLDSLTPCTTRLILGPKL
jgi:hypothetical protein